MSRTARVVIEVTHNDGKIYKSLQDDLFKKGSVDQLNAIRKYFRQIAGGTAGNVSVQVNVNDAVGVKANQTLAFAGTNAASAAVNDVITVDGIGLTAVAAPSTAVQWQARALVTCASASAINTTTSVFTATAHKLTLGEKVFFTTQTTAPQGMTSGTNYYVVPLTANTFKLATSYEYATRPTAVTVGLVATGDAAGTGNQYFVSRLLPAQSLAACINSHSTLCNVVYASCSTVEAPVVTVYSLYDGLAGKAIPLVKTTGTSITIGSGGNVLQSGTDSTNGKTSLAVSVG